VLALNPSLQLYVAGASEEGAIPVLYLGNRHLEEEELRVFDSRTREDRKVVKGAFGYEGREKEGAITRKRV
jgi:hypothetical protein